MVEKQEKPSVLTLMINPPDEKPSINALEMTRTESVSSGSLRKTRFFMPVSC